MTFNKFQNSIPSELQNSYIKNYYNFAQKYEYCNDEYSIIACKNLEDLVIEGSTLHHCVGSMLILLEKDMNIYYF